GTTSTSCRIPRTLPRNLTGLWTLLTRPSAASARRRHSAGSSWRNRGRRIDEGPFVVMRSPFVQANRLGGTFAGDADDAADGSNLTGRDGPCGPALCRLTASLLSRLGTALPCLLRLCQRHEVVVGDRVFVFLTE